jgi:hypothetical protein
MNGKRGRIYQRQRPLKKSGSLICMCRDGFSASRRIAMTVGD